MQPLIRQLRQRFAHQFFVCVMSAGLVIMLPGCGSFAFAPGSVVSKHQVTEYHPNGTLKLQGWIGVNDQGTEVKTDDWQLWYDNGQPQWQGFYLNNVVDAGREWTEWNRNGSLRDTWIDD
jgi:hypothetical protein